MTYFHHPAAAERYAHGRPYFHPLVVRKIGAALGLTEPLPQALDVGCGTGQSCLALRKIAAQVVGTDTSPAMLTQAPRDAHLHYVVAAAERLPFAAGTFPLLTVALAFHWFDRARFLAEAFRVLAPAGWLVIYDNAFRGTMLEQPDFASWCRDTYLERYPTPPRDRRPLTDADAAAHGFRLVEREIYTNDVPFTRRELVDYLLTQSNVIAAVEQGAERLDDVRPWLAAALRPFFTQPQGTFRFSGAIAYLRKRSAT